MAKRKRDWKTFLKWVFFPFTLPFSKDMQSEFSSGGAFDDLDNQIGSFINSKTGAHLTGAQQEANQFSASMAEQEYARQEEFYLKYQSPKALLRQGVNPFGVNGSTGGQSISGGAPSSVTPSSPQSSNLFDIVQLLFGMQQQKRLNDSQIQLNDSAAKRNLSEVNERNINSETLKDMNLATIMEKLSNVELNTSNVKLITSKIFNTDADTNLKNQYAAKVVAEILNIEADTNVKAEQLNVMLAEIANINADTELKRKQFEKLISDILVNDKQLDVFSAQIGLMSTQAGLNRSEAVKVQAEWKKLLQDYDRDELLNSFQYIITGSEAGKEKYFNPDNYTGLNRELRIFLNQFAEIFSFSIVNK